MADQIILDETQRRVNRLMGMSDEEFLEIKSKRSPDESVEGIDEAVSHVAKMMGIDVEDIKKYGYKEPFAESG